MKIAGTELKADHRGRVCVYCLATKKWIWRQPIDVKEGLKRGTMSVEGPKPTKGKKSKSEGDGEGEGEGNKPRPELEVRHDAFDALKVPELRELCETAKIDFKGMKKDDLVKALVASELPNPSEGDGEGEGE